jgi:hypothetical protein
MGYYSDDENYSQSQGWNQNSQEMWVGLSMAEILNHGLL